MTDLLGPAGIALHWDLAGSTYLTGAAGMRAASDRGLLHYCTEKLPVHSLSHDRIDALGPVVSESGRRSIGALLDRGDHLIRLDYRDGELSLQSWAGSRVAGRAALLEVIRGLDDIVDLPDEDHTAVRFDEFMGHGFASAVRPIATPAWMDIHDNYPPEVGSALSRLTDAFRPVEGALVLMHGDPGTGKTYALRSLIRAWREWADPIFLVDPVDALSGVTSRFVQEVLDQPSPDFRYQDREDRWRLLVLEDAGELLSLDAREGASSALTKLLNITDGILGEGFRTIVAVTTNEPLGKLHPAVRRPGRRLAEVDFRPLFTDQANRWLEERGSARRVERPTPLAELYAIDEDEPPGVRQAFGFAAASE